MSYYTPFATTVVGSYSVPRWYEALEREVETGHLSRAEMANAQFVASQGAILDQDTTGIDILTGGEMHRRTNNRHAPPNAMLNFFWGKIPGFSDEVRHKPITGQDPNVTHPAAVCNGPIRYADLGLVAEYRMVSRFAEGAVKVTMTGPHMLAKVAHDDYYGDLSRMMQDLAKVINRNLKDLEAAGCRYAQIDEPLFAAADKTEVAAAVDAINMAIEGLSEMSVMGHICQGNYAVGEAYDGQIGHRYFTGSYPAELIAGINYDALLVEHDMVDAYQGLLGNKRLAVGAVDVQSLEVESPETVVQRIHKHSWLAPEQTLITSTCGMNHLPRDVAFGKLEAMAMAKQIFEPAPRQQRAG
ncbi:MAG: hypothetical protein ABEJ96_05480 [Thiohalorhabdaceae bacterium]